MNMKELVAFVQLINKAHPI